MQLQLSDFVENIERLISFLIYKSWQIIFLNQPFRLENALRSFACLTVEDLIEFKYNDKVSVFFITTN